MVTPKNYLDLKPINKTNNTSKKSVYSMRKVDGILKKEKIIQSEVILKNPIALGNIDHKIIESKIEETTEVESSYDDSKRMFLKVAGVAGLGLAASALFPKGADAYVAGSTPTSNVVGMKNIANVKINPATEDGNLATIAGKDFAKETGGNLATVATNTTPLANLQLDASNYLKVNIAAGSTSADSVQIKDASSNIINPSSDESIMYLRRIVKLMESQATVDSSNRQRISIDATTVTQPVSGTVTSTVANATVTSVTSLNQLNGVDPKFLLTDTARNAYANGIRNNLSWS